MNFTQKQPSTVPWFDHVKCFSFSFHPYLSLDGVISPINTHPFHPGIEATTILSPSAPTLNTRPNSHAYHIAGEEGRYQAPKKSRGSNRNSEFATHTVERSSSRLLTTRLTVRPSVWRCPRPRLSLPKRDSNPKSRSPPPPARRPFAGSHSWKG